MVRGLAVAGLLLAIATVCGVQLLGGDPADAATAAGKKSVVKTKTFSLSQPDNRTRFEVLCGGGKVPLGGGMSFSPAASTGGEGVYPNSYERLGRQGGYHITAALVDLGGGNTEGRNITLQVVCLPEKLGRVTPPHQTVFVQPGETKELTIKCPGKRQLIGGGHQRTTFVSNGGNRIMESRAISSKAWRVVARADRNFGGELTGFAYCIRSKKPLLKEVTATVALPFKTPGSVTTPSCPKGRTLGFVGFSTPSADRVVYMGGSINAGGSSTATAYNNALTPSAPPSSLTAYGYCLKV